MKTKATYKQIADIVGKNEQTIKGWKNKSPELLKLVKLGAFCKINNLDEVKILEICKSSELFKDSK